MGRRSLLNDALAVIHAFSPITWATRMMSQGKYNNSLIIRAINQCVRKILEEYASRTFGSW